MPPPRTNTPLSSSRFIARRAVGAVNIAFTLYSFMIRQNTPALGVPIGLPSYKIDVDPFRRGA
jgi:hypothetical protein